MISAADPARNFVFVACTYASVQMASSKDVSFKAIVPEVHMQTDNKLVLAISEPEGDDYYSRLLAERRAAGDPPFVVTAMVQPSGEYMPVQDPVLHPHGIRDE